MDVRPQQSAGEFGYGIADIDDGAARDGPHVQPLGRRLARRRRRRQDLQAADAVEEQGQRAEIGVRAEGGLRGGRVLRWGFEEANLVARGGGETVQGDEGVGWEVQVLVEVGEEEREDGVGCVDV